jgi:hypothetical protein
MAALKFAAVGVGLAVAVLVLGGCRKETAKPGASSSAQSTSAPSSPAPAVEKKDLPHFDALDPRLNLPVNEITKQFANCSVQPELPVTFAPITDVVPIYRELFRDKNGHVVINKALEIEGESLDALDFDRVVLTCDDHDYELVTDKTGAIVFYGHTYEVSSKTLKGAIELMRDAEPKPCEQVGPTHAGKIKEDAHAIAALVSTCDVGEKRWVHLVRSLGKKRLKATRAAIVRERWEQYLTNAQQAATEKAAEESSDLQGGEVTR